MRRIQEVQALRRQCANSEIICDLIREENHSLNSNIRSLKMAALGDKLGQFREKHGVAEASN